MSDEHDEIIQSDAEALDAAALDEDLSAWVDGELSEERAAALRILAGSSPAVAARIAEFEALGRDLSALVEAPESELGGRLRTSLAARLSSQERPALASEGRRGRGPAPSRPGRRRWSRAASAGLVGAAVAAGLALFFALRPAEAPLAPEADAVEVAFEDASSDELQMALELQVLEDLEVIEHLDVLERLQVLDDDAGRG